MSRLVTVYRYADGTWRYVIDLPAGPDGRRCQARRGGFRTRAEAVRAEAGLRAAPPKANSHDTFGTALDAWLAASEPEWAGSTARWYRDMIKLLEPLRNQYVTPDLLERHYQWLLRHGGRRGEGVAPGTVRAVHKTLLQALKFADDRGLDPGYATRTKLPRVERREADAWTPDEARAFLQAMTTERLHSLFVLAVHTGMRRGELAGLRWSDVELDRRSVAIRRQRAYDGVASESVGPRLTPTWTDRHLYHLDHEHG